MGSPDAPIVCVRGNHDFIDLAPLFSGCNLLHEFVNNELIEWNGVKITGHQGIPYIYGGWNDEVQPADLHDRLRAMPKADIFLTHYAPAGMLDCEYHSTGAVRAKYGLQGMGPIILNKANADTALHCFGHIHGDGGKVLDVQGFLFSNAAEAVNVIDFEVKHF